MPPARVRSAGPSPNGSAGTGWTAACSTGGSASPRPAAPSRRPSPRASRGLPPDLDLELRGDRVLLDGRDVTREVGTEEAGTGASRVAALAPVRAALLERQRGFRRPPGLVADGRDMGTVVFPDATWKVFLTASPEVRARRRYNQLRDQGMDVSLAGLFEAIRERDERDRTREAAPLRAAEGAFCLDTTHLGVEETLERVMEHVRTTGRPTPPASPGRPGGGSPRRTPSGDT